MFARCGCRKGSIHPNHRRRTCLERYLGWSKPPVWAGSVWAVSRHSAPSPAASVASGGILSPQALTRSGRGFLCRGPMFWTGTDETGPDLTRLAGYLLASSSAGPTDANLPDASSRYPSTARACTRFCASRKPPQSDSVPDPALALPAVVYREDAISAFSA
jgi:hypothetical protein